MLSEVWSFHKKSTPCNFFKARMNVKVPVSNLGSNLAVNSNIKLQSSTALPYKSKTSPSTYTIQVVRRTGSDDIWELKFDFQFGSEIEPVHKVFRGYFSLRNYHFGVWEPFNCTTFFTGQTELFKNENGVSCHKLHVSKRIQPVDSSLSSQFTQPGKASERSLEGLLVLEFCESTVLSQIQMEAAISAKNFHYAHNKTDCAIQVNNSKYLCHSKNIMSVSPVWKKIFEKDNKDTGDARISKDWSQYFTNQYGIQLFLRFVYYNHLPRKLRLLKPGFEILKFAHMFHIQTLERAAQILLLQSKLVENMEPKLGFEIYTFTKKVDGLQDVKNRICGTLKRNASTYTKDVLVELAKADADSFVDVFQCYEVDDEKTEEPQPKKARSHLT